MNATSFAAFALMFLMTRRRPPSFRPGRLLTCAHGGAVENHHALPNAALPARGRAEVPTAHRATG